MSKKGLHVNCSICNEIYNFGVVDKSNLEVLRIYENGSFCHSCFSEFCNDCMQRQDIGIKHSLYDDKNLCKFEKCKLRGLLKCLFCVSNSAVIDINKEEEDEELPPPPKLERETTSLIGETLL